MKKLIVAAMLILALAGCAKYTAKDVNGDSEININDILYIRSYIESGQYTSTADVNEDGELTEADIAIIRRHILN